MTELSARVRFRDIFRLITPWWLSDRLEKGKTVGYRILFSMIAPLDAPMEVLFQGIQAAYPGRGTPTALPYIGRSRGIIRGQGDTHEEYARKLRAWLDRWDTAGTAIGLGREIHEFLGNRPRVRIVNRAGVWVTWENGAATVTTGAWDWDSVSHPERNDPDAPYWSDEWIIVYPTQWAIRPGVLGDVTDDGFALGHLVTREEVDAVTGLIAEWKAAHSRVRAVIWTSDPARFDPTDPMTGPDGTWGAWGTTDSGSRVKSGRDLTTCRYWEPR